MSLFAHMEAIGRPVAYYPRLAKFFGSVNSAILFSQLFYWQQRCDNKLGVFKTSEEWSEETGLSYREQATARQHLIKRGFLVETNKRLEHRIYFRLEQEVVDAEFGEWNKVQIANDESAFPERRKRISGNDESAIGGTTKAQSVINTETTSETTSFPAPPTGSLGAVEGATVKAEKPAKTAKAAKPPKADKSEADAAKLAERQEVCRQTWVAYCEAYQARYRIKPARNETVNSQIINFVKRLGHDAPEVARFFVSRVNEAFVVGKCHDLGLLLTGYQGYRTQWATDQTITQTRARQIDQSQSNYDAAGEAMALIRAHREKNNAQ